ncbi:Hypothetical protein R9X50_00188000 [Acrodontium crateriforme]|uniref:Uncharacterized protein n=1 Tax=Acrodontium crateriforme TaxID=150365 RepID=A0AAQ3R337_9PEZI|nr:Hypothetical protein R9X50_00188000 [Acrodontium crateriforme]
MAFPLLFCVAEEAKAFAHKMAKMEMPGGGPKVFYLVKSRHLEKTADCRAQLEQGIDSDADFHTNFIGASIKDCQDWALQNTQDCNNIESSVVAVADTRSAKDGTLLLSKYNVSSGGQLFFCRFGPLPPEDETCYEWRIKPDINDNAYLMMSDLSDCGEPDSAYPVYYGSQNKFTDTDGVFDVTEARRFVTSEDADVLQSDIRRWLED